MQVRRHDDLAAGTPPLDPDAVVMASCRVVDNAAVALAAIDRAPVAAARLGGRGATVGVGGASSTCRSSAASRGRWLSRVVSRPV